MNDDRAPGRLRTAVGPALGRATAHKRDGRNGVTHRARSDLIRFSQDRNSSICVAGTRCCARASLPATTRATTSKPSATSRRRTAPRKKCTILMHPNPYFFQARSRFFSKSDKVLICVLSSSAGRPRAPDFPRAAGAPAPLVDGHGCSGAAPSAHRYRQHLTILPVTPIPTHQLTALHTVLTTFYQSRMSSFG